MLKKTFAVLGTLALAFTLASCGGAKSDEQLMEEGWVKNPAENGWVEADKVQVKKDLPAAPAKDFSKEKSPINAQNLHEYLGRDDVVYIDLRDNEKGYLKSHLRGFESIEFYGVIYDSSKDGSGKQLFKGDFSPRYKESEQIINTLFPKDKAIFLNCTSGARVVKMMNILDSLNYDMTKVYNVGGAMDFDKEATLRPYIVKNPFVNATVTYEFLDTLHPIA